MKDELIVFLWGFVQCFFISSFCLYVFIWWYEKLILELPNDCTICIKILRHRSRKNFRWRLTATFMELILLWSIFYTHFDIPYSHWYSKLILKISSFIGKSWYFTFLWFTFLKNIAVSYLHLRKESLKENFFRTVRDLMISIWNFIIWKLFPKC